MTRAGQIRAPRRQNPKGLAVIVNYAGHAADAENVVQEIRAAGGRAVAVKADVSVPAEVAELFDKAEESFGGIDIIVNNAGIMQQGLVSVADTDDALFDRLFAINVKGTFNTLRLAAKRLRQGGRIVNFSTRSSDSRCLVTRPTPPRSRRSKL
jgi:3-oxoacyl-[acyl-carrier protein] reductase